MTLHVERRCGRCGREVAADARLWTFPERGSSLCDPCHDDWRALLRRLLDAVSMLPEPVVIALVEMAERAKPPLEPSPKRT